MRAKSCVVGVCIAALIAVTAAARGQETSEASTISAGATTFRHYCRTCHGTEARGDGPVAQYLTPKPADLTRIRERNKGEFPSEAVYDAIAGGKSVKGHGTSEMPVWGEAFREVQGGQNAEKVKERIEQLVAYLRSIQAPPPAG
jgi:mono/diheme cytochrome c family protein